jgi:hypothetical protein
MKTAEDAKVLRERINACFELANLPDSSDEERRRLLNFVVVGPGTGSRTEIVTVGPCTTANALTGVL